MKFHFIKIMTLVSLMSLLFSCSEETSNPNQKVSFSFDVTDSSSRDSLTPTKVIVSIEQDGDEIKNLTSLELYNSNGSYISEELELPGGDFSVTEFLVTDDSNSIIYLTPKVGSDFENFVTTPLPHLFNVESEESTIVVLDVIDAQLASLEEFGYSSFTFNIVDYFKVGLQLYLSFDGGVVADSSTNNHVFTSYGDVQFSTDRDGVENNAISFDGVDEYISMSNSLVKDYEKFTCSVWLKPDNFDVEYVGFFNQSPDYYVSEDGNRDQVIGYFTRSKYHPTYGGFGWTINFQDYSWLDTRFVYDDEPNKWVHYVSTYDGEVWVNYINGFEISRHEIESNKLLGNSYPLEIGRTRAFPSTGLLTKYYKGSMDEYRVYDRALSEYEVYQLYKK
ncbi:LamG domain-containing protein [Flammeovirga sp. MY04]|uniref:LamG domain-containing protein n=1 Tax=Flammeovirga sp. MY04 TaxID=1191459 RepID=UPI000A001C2B|nr:LamG domain-containing protein [Flammeovirga sp. MY04]ANQ50123.2 LamG domain-containing protein [Flammeovirga sp. MY04]